MNKKTIKTIKLTCKYCGHPGHFGVDGYQKCKECGCIVLEKPTLPAKDWEFEFDSSRMVSALYYNIEAGEAEAIHVALRDFIRNLVTKVSSAAAEEEREFYKEKVLPDCVHIDTIMEMLDGMGMELPPKNEDDRPYAEGFNAAVEHIKDQIKHLWP